MRPALTSYVRPHARSTSLYYVRDVPADLRAAVGRSKWKRSLGTASHALALKKARPLADEHDALIARLRAPAPEELLKTLSAEDQERIANSGGLPGHLKWVEQRAGEAIQHESSAETWSEAANEPGDDPDLPDPDWTSARVAAWRSEAAMIRSQLGREERTLRKLGLPWRRCSPPRPLAS